MSSRWQVLVLSMMFALAACGGGPTTGDDSTPPDQGQPTDEGADEGTPQTDDGGPTPDEGVTTPDTPDVPVQGDEGTVDPDVEDDAEPPQDPGPGDDLTDIGPQPDVPVLYVCPCNQDIDAPVCGIDNVTYKNDTCAKCDLCKPSLDCPTCSGGMDCVENIGELPSYLKKKTACDVCECKIADACAAMFGGPGCATQKVCSTDNVSYDNLCDMVQKVYDASGYCDENYDFEELAYFGTATQGCKPPACEPCEMLADNPVCGSDGKTYRNKCELTNCPKTVGVTTACVGACADAGFCPACAGQPCETVCGDDGISYSSQCAATTCGTKNKLVAYPGACCPECEGEAPEPVCGEDHVIYPNFCAIICRGVQPCATTGVEVCGADGQTYANECQANCHGGVLHNGACEGICDQCPRVLDPVCGKDAAGKTRSFQSACFATCLGGTVTGAGLCQIGCVDQCGTIASPTLPVNKVCADDGLTYPNACFPQKCFGNIPFTAGACP